jgi:hypothetical protein
MSDINLLKDKDVNYFIIYFYFTLFFFSFLTTHVLFDKHVYFDYKVLWFFDELLYIYLVWSLFSLLNLSNISFKNKIKSYFTISIMVFITLISIYFIFSIGNIYKINFPDQFLSLYVNSVVFVTAIFLIFIYFTRTLLKNDLNKHNFILINSYFFLIILFIAMLFIVVNKPKHFLSFTLNYFPLLIMENLSYSFLFLFIPFLNFLFLFLIYLFNKQKIIPYLVITIIASWDILLILSSYTLSPYYYYYREYYIESFGYLFEWNLLYNSVFYTVWILLYIFMKRARSLISTVVLFNIIMILLYWGFFAYLFLVGVVIFPLREPSPYNLNPALDLVSLIDKIILFLLFVNLVIYIRGKLAIRALK